MSPFNLFKFWDIEEKVLVNEVSPKMTDYFNPFITLNGCSVLHPRTEMGRFLMPVKVKAVPPMLSMNQGQVP
jgi:hypothetical protein